MAVRENLPIPADPDFSAEIGGLNQDDPVHYAQMNAILTRLLTNDVFLEKLASKMVEKTLIAHVLDSTNTSMVLGADQAPALTALLDTERERITKLNSDITVLNTKNDNYGKILWTGSSFFATPENVPDCSNYKVLIFYNSIGAYSVWRDSILTFTYLANSSLYIDTFSVLRNGNTIKLTNNTRYCAGTISTSDIPITKIMGVV